MTPIVLSDFPSAGEVQLPAQAGQSTGNLSSGVARKVAYGTTALGAGVFIERALGFLANILAARFAGAPTFGAYSLAISTANNISTYAAGGIGATATRFSGKYGFASAGYLTLARVLVVVSLVSATASAVALWFGAGPIAHLLHKAPLTGLLRWAALSAAGMILLECARGFFVGQHKLVAVVLLSLVVALGMLVLLPWMAHLHNPTRMVIAQGAVTLTAVVTCLMFYKQIGLAKNQTNVRSLPFAPLLREVWGFGGVQLAGLVGANLSGWWLTALIARSDTSLVQMSFFAIASQLRNLVGIAPGLLTEGSYAVMADPEHEHLRTPQRVMALCSFASAGCALILAAIGIVVVPWVLLHLYGRSYRGAALTASIGLATAIVHMGNAPAAARLSIVSIRATGFINTVWAITVAIAASLLFLHGGSAALAMSIFFAAHVLSAVLVLIVLLQKDFVPTGMSWMLLLSTSGALSLIFLAIWRSHSTIHEGWISLLTILIASAFIWLLVVLGRRNDWLPATPAVKQIFHSAAKRVRNLVHRRVVNHG